MDDSSTTGSSDGSTGSSLGASEPLVVVGVEEDPGFVEEFVELVVGRRAERAGAAQGSNSSAANCAAVSGSQDSKTLL